MSIKIQSVSVNTFFAAAVASFIQIAISILALIAASRPAKQQT